MSRKVVIYNMYIAPRHLAQKVHFTFCHMKKMTFATCKLSNPSPLSSWQIYKMLVARTYVSGQSLMWVVSCLKGHPASPTCPGRSIILSTAWSIRCTYINHNIRCTYIKHMKTLRILVLLLSGRGWCLNAFG